MPMWTKGTSGNPSGRPKKGRSLVELLRYRIQDRCDAEEYRGKRNDEAVVAELIKLAMDGDLAAIKYIFDRLEGKPVQPTATEPKENDADSIRETLDAKIARLFETADNEAIAS